MIVNRKKDIAETMSFEITVYSVYVFFVAFLITKSVARRITIPAGKRTYALDINAARRYVTNDTAATVIAYGS